LECEKLFDKINDYNVEIFNIFKFFQEFYKNNEEEYKEYTIKYSNFNFENVFFNL
jgi:hypothetical protein